MPELTVPLTGSNIAERVDREAAVRQSGAPGMPHYVHPEEERLYETSDTWLRTESHRRTEEKRAQTGDRNPALSPEELKSRSESFDTFFKYDVDSVIDVIQKPAEARREIKNSPSWRNAPEWARLAVGPRLKHIKHRRGTCVSSSIA